MNTGDEWRKRGGTLAEIYGSAVGTGTGKEKWGEGRYDRV